MLIPFKTLQEKFHIKPTGVFHLGGSHAEELEAYLAAGLKRLIFVEAIPEVFAKMEQRLEPYPMAIPINACISDTEGEKVKFHVTNNDGQSSSMLELAEHLKMHPDVHVVRSIELVTQTVDGIVHRRGIDLTYYDFLNIDLQGAELLALRGMKENLHKINYVYIEVNQKELYKGCPMVEELDAFLSEFGFTRVETRWTDWGWGDAFYMKK